MRVPLPHEPDPVLAVMQVFHHARRRGPLRAFGGLGERDAPRGRVRHHHDEADRLAVGRPLRVARFLSDARDLGRGAFRVHPANEDLRALGLAIGEVEDAPAVGGPARVRSLHQEAVVRAVGAHDPERRLPLVLDLVHPAARVNDLGAVGRDPRIGDLLPVEVVIDGEQGVGSGLLSGGGDGDGSEPGERRGEDAHGCSCGRR